MSMTIPEAHSEIQNLYVKADEIEKRYPDGLTKDANAEDYEQVKKLLGEIDGLEQKLAGLEDVESRQARIRKGIQDRSTPAHGNGHRQPEGDDDGRRRAFKSAGEMFIESAEFKRITDSGLLSSPNYHVDFAVPLPADVSMLNYALTARARADQKAIVNSQPSSPTGTTFMLPDLLPGIINILQRELTIMDLIPRTGTTSDTIEYIKEDTYTIAAAMVAEASATTGTSGTKPESTIAYSAHTSPVRTLAHWVPVTNRMLSDYPAIRGIIDNRLMFGLDLKIEDQVIAGSGSGENLTGILNAGIQTVTGTFNNMADSLYHARTLVRTIGLGRPNAYVLHPNDWEAIRLTRENISTGLLGQYLMGPPSVVGPTTLWGLPVVESLGTTENSGLCGDFALGCMYFEREGSQLRTGWINDQFVRNMQTILAEMRAAFVVFRPTAFAQATGI